MRSVGATQHHPRRLHRGRDLLATATVWLSMAVVVAAFAWIVGDLVVGGWDKLGLEFFTAAPRNAGRAGGIAPMLVSTVAVVSVALAATLPLGLATAVLLAEFSGNQDSGFAAWVRRSLDVLAAMPSIVVGLFGSAFFCVTLGMGYSLLAGGLTLACMVLPLMIRVAEQGLRALPDDLRCGAAALGLSRSAAVRRVLLPAALPALTAAVVLSLGRALAETAALLFTSGYVDRMPTSLLDSGRTLSVHIYDLAMNVPGGDRTAYGSALVLLLALLSINTVAHGLTHVWQRRLGGQ